MRLPFVWRKSAEFGERYWKERFRQQQRRAERAERALKTSEFNRRQIAALYDETEQATGRNPKPAAFDPEQARRRADRIAALRAATTRARNTTAAAPAASEGDS